MLGVACSQELGGVALFAQPYVLVPVKLVGRREVVDLGHVEIAGFHAGFLICP